MRQRPIDTLGGELVDRIDGSYTKRVSYDQTKGDPIVSVRYGNITLPDRKLEIMEDGGIQLTPFAGYFWLDDDLPIKDGPVYGVRVRKYVVNSISLEAELGYTPTEDTFLPSQKGEVIEASLNGIYAFNRKGLRNSATVGAGVLRFQNFSSEETSFAVIFGYGLRYNLSSWLNIQVDLRDFVSFKTYGERVSHNLQSTIGYFWRL
jgi:hypothetical protein